MSLVLSSNSLVAVASKLMTGAKQFVATEASLSMRALTSVNYDRAACQLRDHHILDPSDTYTLKACFVRGGIRSKTVFGTQSGCVLVDELQEVYTRATGLYTRIF